MSSFEIKLSEDLPDAPDQGASGGDFSLWAAREALDEGKAYLTEIEKGRDNLSKLGTSLIGWGVPIIFALGGAMLSDKVDAPLRIGAAIALLPVSAAVVIVFLTVRVRTWGVDAIHPDQWEEIIGASLGTYTERQILIERMRSIANAIDPNSASVKSMASRVTFSWFALVATPFIGIAAVLIYRLSSYLAK
jgi:hypothetical protein